LDNRQDTEFAAANPHSICGRMIYRAATLAKIEQISGGLDVAFPNAQQRIDDSVSALLNADFQEVREP